MGCEPMKNLCLVTALLCVFLLSFSSFAQENQTDKCLETIQEKKIIENTHEYSVESFYDYPIPNLHGCAIVKLEIWKTGRVISDKVIRSSGSSIEDWQKTGLRLRFRPRDQKWTGLVHIIVGAEDYGDEKPVDRRLSTH